MNKKNEVGKDKKVEKVDISKQSENEEFDIKDIYTPLSVAKKEIWRRWNDKVLRKKVEDFLGGELPEVFKKEPRAALFRFMTTPNLEFQIASDTARLLDLNFIFMEFLNDKFCTRNQDKLHLGKMIFFHQKNGEDACINDRKKIIDLEKCDGEYFKKIKTVWGEDFIKFHHRIFNEKYKKIDTFDVSEFKTNGESAYDVYLKVFALFICNGVLFENYFVGSNKDEKKFTFDVVKPAFDRIQEIFGLRPLIVPLVSYKVDGDIFWQYYPDDLINKIDLDK
ncbi:MAG TPA: hypothetical protein DIT25_04625 [Candidatus Moranbacteria bacterium]|nr:hypothetical protein [Candidatus Moranbacteria bacterium]